ncbi:MAG: hypothetical protein WDN49_12035 [Acetobacteraceae bacterium]
MLLLDEPTGALDAESIAPRRGAVARRAAGGDGDDPRHPQPGARQSGSARSMRGIERGRMV